MGAHNPPQHNYGGKPSDLLCAPNGLLAQPAFFISFFLPAEKPARNLCLGVVGPYWGTGLSSKKKKKTEQRAKKQTDEVRRGKIIRRGEAEVKKSEGKSSLVFSERAHGCESIEEIQPALRGTGVEPLTSAWGQPTLRTNFFGSENARPNDLLRSTSISNLIISNRSPARVTPRGRRAETGRVQASPG